MNMVMLMLAFSMRVLDGMLESSIHRLDRS